MSRNTTLPALHRSPSIYPIPITALSLSPSKAYHYPDFKVIIILHFFMVFFYHPYVLIYVGLPFKKCWNNILHFEKYGELHELEEVMYSFDNKHTHSP